MREEKGFLKQFTIIGSGTLINMLLGLISTPLITRVVSPLDYGKYSIFTMYGNIAVMVLCCGLDQALVRFYYENKSFIYRRNLLYKSICLPFFFGCIASGIIIGLVKNCLIRFEFNLTETILLCVYTVSQIIYRFSQLVIRLDRKAKIYSMLQVLQNAVYIVMVLLLFNLKVKKYLLVLIFSVTISTIVCIVVSIASQYKIWNLIGVRIKGTAVSMKELLRYSFPFVFSMGVQTLFQAIDKISLNIHCNYSEVGVYSSTLSLVNIFAIIQTAFNTLWAPISVEHCTLYPNDKAFHQKANQLITVVMFSLGISIILFKNALALFLGEEYREAAYILPFLIFSPIMYTISETTVIGLVYKKRSDLQVVVAVGACITNIILNGILVPLYGGKGASISTGLSYIVFYLLRTILGMKFYYVDYKLGRYMFLTFVVAVYALLNTFLEWGIWTIVGYFICSATIIVLYYPTIIGGIKCLKKRENFS